MHKVKAKGILSASNGINIYRGCLHGCIYCDSRSDCYQMKHKFEDIEVKENAPELLEKALSSKRKPCNCGKPRVTHTHTHSFAHKSLFTHSSAYAVAKDIGYNLDVIKIF
jgi:hypothetical protein